MEVSESIHKPFRTTQAAFRVPKSIGLVAHSPFLAFKSGFTLQVAAPLPCDPSKRVCRFVIWLTSNVWQQMPTLLGRGVSQEESEFSRVYDRVRSPFKIGTVSGACRASVLFNAGVCIGGEGAASYERYMQQQLRVQQVPYICHGIELRSV